MSKVRLLSFIIIPSVCVFALGGCSTASSASCQYKNLTSGQLYVSQNSASCSDALRQCRDDSVYGWRCSKVLSA